MSIEDLLLSKEELPIRQENIFLVPIYPPLLSPDIRLDPTTAHRIFPLAAQQWYADLKVYATTLPEGQEKEWINTVFLKEEPRIEVKYGQQIVQEFWEDGVHLTETGFAQSLSISRDAGGTLFLDRLAPYTFAQQRLIVFTPDKLARYKDVREGRVCTYQQHNIDHYPGALFLRNWAILYLNESLRQLFDEK